jgi:SpoVK/Ycf46/Vps4 family AAA+-type ATPase
LLQESGTIEALESTTDEMVLLDTTVQIPCEGHTERFRDFHALSSLIGRVRPFPHRMASCDMLTLRVPFFQSSTGAKAAIRRFLQNRIISCGATVHFGSGIRTAAKVELAEPLKGESLPSEHLLLRVAPNTRIRLVKTASFNHESSQNSKTSAVGITGIGETLARLRQAVIWPHDHTDDAIALGLQFPRGVLLHGPPGVGKTAAVKAVAAEAGAVVHSISAGDVFGPYSGDSEARLRSMFKAAQRDHANGSVVVLLLDEIDILCPTRGRAIDGNLHVSRIVAQLLTLLDNGSDTSQLYMNLNSNNREGNCEFNRCKLQKKRPVVIATTNRPNALDVALRRHGRFDIEMEMSLPSVTERIDILKLHTRLLSLSHDVDINYIARVTKGFSGADIACLSREATLAAIRQNATGPTRGQARRFEILVSMADFLDAADRICATVMRGKLTELPLTTWDDIAGMVNLKKRLIEAVDWPLKHAAAFACLGLSPPRGILLHGPSGCAKTTLARAAATFSGATIVTLTAADIFSKYVGEGEQTLCDAFNRARRAAPSIIILDEIDGIVGSRCSNNFVSSRMLSVLLTEMDGLGSAGENVLVLATTNRLDALDDALLRPGRLDLVLFTPPLDKNGRAAALKVHAKTVPLAKDVDLNIIAAHATRFTGAELRALVREASLAALRDDLNTLQVTQKHLLAALDEMNPTLSEADFSYWSSFKPTPAAS